MVVALIDEWLSGAESSEVVDGASVVLVAGEVRRAGAAAGLPPVVIERVAAAASELARNQIAHACGGRFAIRAVTRLGTVGLEVIAADEGRGIADPGAVLRGESAAPAGLGVGLSAARRLVDEMDIDVRWGEGTCIAARAFAGLAPRSEVGVVGQIHPGETVSGDGAAWVRSDGVALLAVVDGLGHGPPARDAARAALAVVRADPEIDPLELLARCDAALTGGRGAVMDVVRLDLRSRQAVHAGAGNVITRVLRRDGSVSRMGGSARTLGTRQGGRSRAESFTLGLHELLIVHTDGLVSRLDLSGRVELLDEPPVAVAQRLHAEAARGNDDALVLVAH